MLPGALILLLGVGAPLVVDSLRVRAGAVNRTWNGVQIPPSHWKLWSGGPVPVLSAPDGRQLELSLFPLYPGASLAIYNPYQFEREWATTSDLQYPRLVFPDLSDRKGPEALRASHRRWKHDLATYEDLLEKRRTLEGWQLSRALADVHGLEISAKEAARRFVNDYDHRDGALRAFVDTRPVKDPRRAPGLAFLVVSIWFLSSLGVIRRNCGQRTRSGQIRSLVFQLALVFLSLGVLLGMPIYASEGLRRWYIHQLTRLVTSPVPAVPWALWSYVVAVAICWYLILLRRFRQTEPPQFTRNPLTGRDVVVR